MNFYKIFKTFNSAQSSWQVSLAITLGMISGFLPLFTLINFIILFVVFSINIPLAIFLISSALFGSLALVLDPTFASVGFDILNNSSLNSLFTSMYNYAPTLWSSFNHTIVMGSFIISIILFIPTFIIFKILINKYRISFEKWFKDSKYFSWLNPFSEKNLDKKPGTFRFLGFGFILVISTIIVLFVMLLLDPIIKFVLEYGASKASKKEVYIDNVKTSFSNETLDINNIIIKSKEQNNDIKIANINMNINFSRLIHKQVDINNVSFKDIILNTSANTSDKTNASNMLDNSIKNIKSTNKNESKTKKVNLPSVNDILAKEDLQSLKKAKEIKTDINNIYSKYKNFDTNQINKEKLKQLQQRASILKDKIKNIKDASQIQAILDESKAIKNEVSALNDKIKNIKKDYDKDKTLISNHIKTIKTLPKEEYNHLIKKYSLNQNGAMNFVGTYISADAKKYINMALKYYKIVEPYITSDEKELSVEEKRLSGRYIHFKQKNPYPNFVLKSLNGNMTINSFNSSFDIKDISDNQKIYNKKITGYVKGDDTNYKLAKISFVHNGLEDITKTTLNLNVKEFLNKKYQAHPKLSLSKSTINAKANAMITDFKSITANIDTKLTKTTMEYKSSGNKADDIIKSILSNIHSFNIKSNIVGNIKDPSISISSNLDKQIASGLKSVLNKKVAKFKVELKNKLNKKFKDEVGSKLTNKKFDDIKNMLSDMSNGNASISDTLNKSATKDALMKKIQDKAKAKLDKKKEEEKQKAKDKLKNSLENKFKSLF